MRASIAAACAYAITSLSPLAARAEERPAHEAVRLAAVVPIAGGATAAAILIGSSGQLYEPAGDRGWSRKTVGGVAGDVVGAAADERGAIYAVAGETPIFRYGNGTWHANPLPNRGRTIVAPLGGVPALAVGRHVYLLRGTRWVRWLAAPQRIAALWGSSKRRVYIADGDGKLAVGDGRKWQAVAHGLASDDRIVDFVGVPGKELYALAKSGAVLVVGSTAATPATRAPELEGFRTELACPDLRAEAAGVLLIGPAPRPDGSTEPVLVAGSGGTLRLLEALPRPAPGDRYAAAYAGPDGELLLATHHGVVRIRAADGTWREGRVSGAIPDAAKRVFEGAAPAHTR